MKLQNERVIPWFKHHLSMASVSRNPRQKSKSKILTYSDFIFIILRVVQLRQSFCVENYYLIRSVILKHLRPCNSAIIGFHVFLYNLVTKSIQKYQNLQIFGWRPPYNYGNGLFHIKKCPPHPLHRGGRNSRLS